MEIEHNQHIGVYRNAFDSEFCNQIIKYYEENSASAYSRQEFDNVPKLHKKDNALILPDIEKNIDEQICRPMFINQFNEHFYNTCYQAYASEYDINECGENFNRVFKVQKTEPTGGYHVWHCEHSKTVMQRVAAWTLYLNDDFDGGETEFLYQQYRLKPEKGMVCIFPAGYTHMHRGNPPMNGTKYIATGWLEH